MGRIIVVDPSELGMLRVTQDYIRREKVEGYNNIREIVPVILTYDRVRDGYAIIDGHHQIGFSYIYSQPLVAWLSESPNDTIKIGEVVKNTNSRIEYIVEERNFQLKRRFNVAPFYVPIVRGEDVYTIGELLEKSF